MGDSGAMKLEKQNAAFVQNVREHIKIEETKKVEENPSPQAAKPTKRVSLFKQKRQKKYIPEVYTF